MKKVLSVLIFLPLLMSFLTACKDSKPITDALHRAEALMNEHPDSAWAVLNTLSPDVMGRNSTRAHYALLYTQAQDKNYIDETNDSLISVAVDYYRHTDAVRHKFLSYYYKGRVLTNAKDYLNATTCYMEAEQLADEVGDDYLVGLLYAELGRIYRLYYDYPKSLEAHQKAAECYERAGKIRHRNYMWLNQSGVCRNMNESEEGERLLRMVLSSAKEEKDSALIKLCVGDMVMLCIEEERMLEAQNLYKEFKFLADDGFASVAFWGKLVQMHVSMKDFVQARQCLGRGWERASHSTDSVELYFSSSDLLSALGEDKAAYQELLRGTILQTKNAKEVLQHPVLTAQRDYLSEKLAFEAYRVQTEKRLKVLYILLSIFVLLVIVYVFVRLFKQYKEKSQQTIYDLETAKKLVEEEKDKIARALHQLDVDKKNADETIATLKETIDKKEKESHLKIADLKARLEHDQQSMKTLDDVIIQKEESRQKMEALVRKLEDDSKTNAESMARLRRELENWEQEYRLSVRQAEAKEKALLDEKQKMMFQKVELLKSDLEHVITYVLLHEKEWPKKETKERKIQEGISALKKGYFAGDNEYHQVENLVNLYLDNVMMHFRNEVILSSESEYRRVCYMFAGISGQLIGEIMNESKDAVYQRRSRLLKKIDTLSCIHKDLFILLLSKQLRIK